MSKGAPNKTKAEPTSVAAFVDAVANPVRQADARVLIDLMERVSGAPAIMWGPSIIGFGTCHYVYDSGREGDMPRIAFSPRSGSLVFYLSDAFDGAAELLGRLGKHKTSVACLYVNKLADVDMAVLEEMCVRTWGYMEVKYPR